MPLQPSCDIFIRSYARDFDWLFYCLASIERFCRGFRSVVVVVPRSSRPRLAPPRLTTCDARVVACDDYRDDYLGQQATKLHADLFTDGELICHVDSDCIFTRATTPADLHSDGKARVQMRPNALLGRHRPWQRPTEEFLGWPVTYDFMRHPPFTYPRWLYAKVRRHALATHGMSLESYIMSRPPRGFSEYNVLGALAHRLYRESFIWVDTSIVDPGAALCRWYWSRERLDAGGRREIEGLLAPTA